MYNLQSSTNKENLNRASTSAADASAAAHNREDEEDCENPLTKKLLDDQHFVSSSTGTKPTTAATADESARLSRISSSSSKSTASTASRALMALRATSEKLMGKVDGSEDDHPEIRDVLQEMSYAEDFEDMLDGEHENH